MEPTLEQVEKVQGFTGVSSEQARAALAQTQGVPLDAVLLLEQQGRARPATGGSWSTRYGAPPEPDRETAAPGVLQPVRGGRHRRYTSKEVGDAVKSFLRNCTKITVDVWHRDDLLVGIPLVVCVVLFIVAWQLMLPLTILGLILRCRYHISGWEGGTEDINRTMDRVTDAVAELTERAKAEWSGYHNGKKPGK